MKVSAAAIGLKKLREQAGMSVREVADALQRPASTYASYEDKFKKQFLPLELVHSLAPILLPKGVSRSELFALGGVVDGNIGYGSEPSPDALHNRTSGNVRFQTALTVPDFNVQGFPRDMPTFSGAIAGEDGLFEFNGQVVDYVRRPPRLMGVKDAYALYVLRDCMAPWREHGELVYVHPHLPVKPLDYVVVQLKQESEGGQIPAYIKRLVRRSASEIKLLQYNPRKELTILTKKIASIHHIMDWTELLGL